MARTLRPYGEREARWSLALAAMGAISMGATLPAAFVLGTRAIRRRRVIDGSEPVMGALAFGVGLVSFLLIYPAMRVIVMAALDGTSWRPRAFLLSLALVASAIVALAGVVVRIHPERWVARRAAVAGVMTGVTVAFAQTAAVVLTGFAGFGASPAGG
jgi:hypothetical protein